MNNFLKNVESQEQRKLKAKKEKQIPFWKMVGTFGIVGWAISVPTIAGIALGRWIDTCHSSPRSWTLILLITGVFMGCWNAWYWVSKESNHFNGDPHE